MVRAAATSGAVLRGEGQVLLEGGRVPLPCSAMLLQEPQAWRLPLAPGAPARGSCSANATGQGGCPAQGWVTSLAAPSLGAEGCLGPAGKACPVLWSLQQQESRQNVAHPGRFPQPWASLRVPVEGCQEQRRQHQS